MAAGPARPASQTSSAAGGAADGLHRPEPDYSAATAAGGGKLHTAPAGSFHCSPVAGGCWPLPAAGQGHAGGEKVSNHNLLDLQKKLGHYVIYYIITFVLRYMNA